MKILFFVSGKNLKSLMKLMEKIFALISLFVCCINKEHISKNLNMI